jgi:hypothetical protein
VRLNVEAEIRREKYTPLGLAQSSAGSTVLSRTRPRPQFVCLSLVKSTLAISV